MAFETSPPGSVARTVGIAVIVIIVAGLCIQVAQAIDRRWAARRATPATATEALSERFTSANRLLTLHYPADFAAQASNESLLGLTRNLPNGGAEVLVFVAVANPITNDTREFTRVAGLTETHPPSDWQYREVSRREGTCNGRPGLEILSTWKPAGTTVRSRRWWCAFLRDGHGYIFSYSAPEDVADAHAPLLRSIVAATTFEHERHTLPR